MNESVATCHLLPNPAEADDEELLVAEIMAKRYVAPATRSDRLNCFRHTPREHERERHDQVRDGVHEDRSCQDLDLPPSSRLKVDVVQADAEVTNDAEALGTGEEGVIDGDPVAEKNAFSVPERKLERWAIAGVCHEGHVAAILYAVEKLFRQRSKDDH